MKEINPTVLAAKLARLKQVPVLVIGDIILDHYILGEVNRISPEAPVPVVKVKSEFHKLGGAGNVAWNIASMGGRPYLFSVAGRDRQADMLNAFLLENKLEHRMVCLADRYTTLKTRVIAQNQQMIRVDVESETLLSDRENAELLSELSKIISQYRVIILSDYAKGLVNQTFMDGLRALLAEQDEPPRLIVDPKTRNFSLYHGCYITTPNTREAAEGSGRPMPQSDHDIKIIAERIFASLDCESLLITMGADGMALFETRDRAWRISTTARKVFDVTGAGDTVVALLALALGAGFSLPEAAVTANFAAGIVVGEIGTASTTVEALQQAMMELDPPAIVAMTV